VTRRGSVRAGQRKIADSPPAAGKRLPDRETKLEHGNIHQDTIEYIKKKTDDGDLVPDTLDPQQLRLALSVRIKEACRELGLPCPSAKKIVNYILDLATENTRKKPLWSERKGEDKKIGDPIHFLNKYWGVEMRSGRFYQADLREADLSLFEAVRRYCRTNGMDPKAFLPPPLKQRSEKRRKLSRTTFSKAAHRVTKTTSDTPRKRPPSKPASQPTSSSAP